MRLPWELHDQLKEINSCDCFTGPELPFFFHKRKGILKIDQSVKKKRDIGCLVWELHAPRYASVPGSLYFFKT